MIIPFPNTFSEEKADKNLSAEFKEEIDGIALWALEGLHRLLERGRFDYKLFREDDTPLYELMRNHFTTFYNNYLEVREGSYPAKDDVYAYYENYCKKNRYNVNSKSSFTNDLVALSGGKIKPGRRRNENGVLYHCYENLDFKEEDFNTDMGIKIVKIEENLESHFNGNK
jgi:putative DNA primase/helicase